MFAETSITQSAHGDAPGGITSSEKMRHSEKCAPPETERLRDDNGLLGFLDPQQFHFKNKRGIRPDERIGSAFAIRELRRDEQLPLVADLHQLQRLDPSGNNAIHLERDRLAALD